MKISELIEKLDKLAPFEDASDWDNPGLLVGRRDAEVKKVFIALDAVDAVIDGAVKEGADLVLTHHPLIFGGVKRVEDADFVGRRVLSLAENKVALIAMHTNFDRHVMNIEAVKKLGLVSPESFGEVKTTRAGELGFGYIGEAGGNYTLKEYIEKVIKAFELDGVNFFGDERAKIERIALVAGSGAEFIGEAAAMGADVLITGDVKYHNGIDAVEKGISVIDAGHYGVEKLFIPYMKEYFERSIPEIGVSVFEGGSCFGRA